MQDDDTTSGNRCEAAGCIVSPSQYPAMEQERPGDRNFHHQPLGSCQLN